MQQTTWGGLPIHPPLSPLSNLSMYLRLSLPPIEHCNEAQIENPIANPTDLLIPYTPICPIDPSFRWGRAEGSAFLLKVDRCYDKVVHWQRNVFSILSGKAGKDFVSELARLYHAYAEGSQIE